ncbi:hydroxyacid dehydrogenase [Cnuibacter sp. UC19_7]|uniref:hydroxyacid dehydrogenase n=1 Tax=Cnuibacter sp. UC19_7 TaxID=3350166 RepID=UPI00366CB1F1
MADTVDGDTSRQRRHALLVMSARTHADLFDDSRVARLRSLVTLGDPARVDVFDRRALAQLAQVEYLITGWGAPRLGSEVLRAAPRLRAILHTGGSVKNLVTDEVWERGIVVTSAAEANAIPVAEFTLAMILLEAKRVPEYIAGYASTRDVAGDWRDGIASAATFGGVVGLVGFSRVGRRVAALLAPFGFDVLVADPYAAPDEVRAAGAHLVELDALMRRSDIVSVHAPELPSTRRLLNAPRIASMRPNAVLINTARGSLIDTGAVLERCRQGLLRAVLDVTDPEPLPADSPLFGAPGVVLTPHIAGAMHAETLRLTDSTLDGLETLVRGGAPANLVDRSMLGLSA